jgi:hypothetical protein
MKHLLVCMGVVFLAVLTLTSCGGGGGGGGDGDNQHLQIDAFDSNTVEPLAKLTIIGKGFNPSAYLTVNFFDDADFSLEVPVLEATTSSVIVAVPPYINKSTGKFESGTVSVRVLQDSTAGSVISNTLTGLDIGALPNLTLAPGEVTANVAGFLELSLTDTINQIAELDRLPGGQFNTGDLRSRLEAIRLQYGELKTKVRNAINNPDQAETIGMINGVPISLDEESLTIADQLMVAIINDTLVQLQVTSPAALSNVAFALTNVSSFCENNPDVCGASGQPPVTLKYYRTGEVTAVEQYHYAMALPGARELFSKVANWFAATSATLGAVATVTGIGTPIVVVAAVTQVNIECMAVKYGLDAARLSANSTDKEAAQDLLEDFTGTLEYMRDSVLSPTIAAISEQAGVVYDLFTGWQPVVEDQIPDYVSQLENFIAMPAPTGDVTGAWFGTVNNPNLGRVGCAGGESYFDLSLNEDDFTNVTGYYGSVPVSGSRTGYTMTINANTRFGNRSYTWTWDGNDTISGSVAYFCWSLETGQLLNEGTGTFSVIRY